MFIDPRGPRFAAALTAAVLAAAVITGSAWLLAGQAVVFAGGTVVIAILGLAVAGVPFMTAGGIAISVIVLVMVVASITLLPAFLGLAGHWINRLGLGRSSANGGATVGSGWHRWGAHVSRNALVYAVGVTVMLVAMVLTGLGSAYAAHRWSLRHSRTTPQASHDRDVDRP